MSYLFIHALIIAIYPYFFNLIHSINLINYIIKKALKVRLILLSLCRFSMYSMNTVIEYIDIIIDDKDLIIDDNE